MKRIFVFFVVALNWRPGNLQAVEQLLNITQDIKSAAVAAVEAINDNVPLYTLLNSNCVEPPKECPNSNVTFWLYSRSRQNNPVQLTLNNLENSSFASNENPWKIIIHGYTKSKDEIPNPELRSEYFKKGEYNLISVDYSPLSKDKCYLASVNNVPLIANCTAQVIEALVEKGAFNLKDLHVIGFSLGAQIAGRLYHFLTSGKPGRVTGLDPASPLFDGDVNEAIGKNAGDFVDIVHTNALGNGKFMATGHVDFYANGGSIQPGCFSTKNESFTSCNHNRGPIYFAESINSDVGFWGIPCESLLRYASGDCRGNQSQWVLMGDRVPSTARGVYYFQTRDKPPFALGKAVLN